MAVRAISDAVSDTLLPFERFTDLSLAWQWNKALPYFLGHPNQIGNLLHLYRNAHIARRCLASFVDLYATCPLETRPSGSVEVTA